jgi:hypothetical protein
VHRPVVALRPLLRAIGRELDDEDVEVRTEDRVVGDVAGGIDVAAASTATAFALPRTPPREPS